MCACAVYLHDKIIRRLLLNGIHSFGYYRNFDFYTIFRIPFILVITFDA